MVIRSSSTRFDGRANSEVLSFRGLLEASRTSRPCRSAAGVFWALFLDQLRDRGNMVIASIHVCVHEGPLHAQAFPSNTLPSPAHAGCLMHASLVESRLPSYALRSASLGSTLRSRVGSSNRRVHIMSVRFISPPSSPMTFL